MSTLVAAVMIVRNEEHILPLSVAHLLHGLGVDRVLIADNGSTDRTPLILRRLSAVNERIRWTACPGPYLQSEIVTGLAVDAHRQGADWIVPTDADEFLWLQSGLLRDRLATPADVGTFELAVRNFVQWSWVRRDHPRAPETMLFSAAPVGSEAEAWSLVEQGAISFVEINYPGKVIVRAAPSMVIHRGNHGASGVDGARAPLPGTEVLHAPLRARDNLDHRVAKARRVEEAGVPEGMSWHLRRLLRMPQERLGAEWEANSTSIGAIGPARGKRRLCVDFRLRRIARRHRAFAARCAAPPWQAGSPSTAPEGATGTATRNSDSPPGAYFVTTVRSSNCVTESAFVHTPTLPGAENV